MTDEKCKSCGKKIAASINSSLEITDENCQCSASPWYYENHENDSSEVEQGYANHKDMYPPEGAKKIHDHDE